MYRFSKENAQTILEMIEEDLIRDPRGAAIPPFQRLCVFLSYIGASSVMVGNINNNIATELTLLINPHSFSTKKGT